ncbi:hypothetical protein C1645_738334 [Glomus cerebriforme]|uniref:Uncharacterized protein n=1 Tax=Glomus cerebriforme TaxID=658196 RepID=A0A397SYW0_9GLOM|nr:hypothetical protein C1645_738334 [Glomus cerebriforme]
MRKGEFPIQWRLRFKIALQDLLSQNKSSIYHRYCLCAGFGEGMFKGLWKVINSAPALINVAEYWVSVWKQNEKRDWIDEYWDSVRKNNCMNNIFLTPPSLSPKPVQYQRYYFERD